MAQAYSSTHSKPPPTQTAVLVSVVATSAAAAASATAADGKPRASTISKLGKLFGKKKQITNTGPENTTSNSSSASSSSITLTANTNYSTSSSSSSKKQQQLQQLQENSEHNNIVISPVLSNSSSYVSVHSHLDMTTKPVSKIESRKSPRYSHHSTVISPNISSLTLNQAAAPHESTIAPSQVIPSSSSANSTVSRANSTRSKPTLPPQQPRFLIHSDGTHEHHLRNSKRQEKVGQMLKDWLGGKKLRSEAISAIPNILSSTNLAALDQEAKDTVDKVNFTATSQHLPPTLFSSLLNQVKRGDVTQYSGNLPPVTYHQQPKNAVSVFKKDQPTKLQQQIDSRSFSEKYGKCQEVVGRGAFGVVRIAHKKNEKTGSEVLFAVKEFKRRPNESDKKYSNRLTNEFCISSSLKHKNIINSYDLLRDAKTDYCEVMEYCSGGDLYSLIITAGKLEYAESDCFFKQLVRGVNYMHEMGVAHRDLKPENILITNTGVLKITDFGNAECFKMAWEDEIQLSHGICGSSPYIAPEEYTKKEFDPRPVDLWACGVIYMAMRSGRQLWKLANSDDEFFFNYLTKRRDAKGYEPIEMLKRARCRNVIYSLLDPVPRRRITGAQLLKSEWVREIKVCKAAFLEPTPNGVDVGKSVCHH